MATDIRVVMPHRQGSAMRILEAVAALGINVDGICGDLRGGENWGYMHVLVEDQHGEEARRVVEEMGFQVTTVRGVEVVELEDEPGAVARALAPYSEAGRNIEVLYMATRTRVVIGTEDMEPRRLGVKMSDI